MENQSFTKKFIGGGLVGGNQQWKSEELKAF